LGSKAFAELCAAEAVFSEWNSLFEGVQCENRRETEIRREVSTMTSEQQVGIMTVSEYNAS
jgi:hypothetical protein